MTGHGDHNLYPDAIKSGASELLEKPFSEEELLRVIDTVLKH